MKLSLKKCFSAGCSLCSFSTHILNSKTQMWLIFFDFDFALTKFKIVSLYHTNNNNNNNNNNTSICISNSTNNISNNIYLSWCNTSFLILYITQLVYYSKGTWVFVSHNKLPWIWLEIVLNELWYDIVRNEMVWYEMEWNAILKSIY